MKIQITLYSTTGKYKPLSTTVEAESVEEFKRNFKTYKRTALSNICARWYKDGNALIRGGYTQMKWRIYDKQERIAYQKQKAIEEFKKERK